MMTTLSHRGSQDLGKDDKAQKTSLLQKGALRQGHFGSLPNGEKSHQNGSRRGPKTVRFMLATFCVDSFILPLNGSVSLSTARGPYAAK